jgi:hypothetical protein
VWHSVAEPVEVYLGRASDCFSVNKLLESNSVASFVAAYLSVNDSGTFCLAQMQKLTLHTISLCTTLPDYKKETTATIVQALHFPHLCTADDNHTSLSRSLSAATTEHTEQNHPAVRRRLAMIPQK